MKRFLAYVSLQPSNYQEIEYQPEEGCEHLRYPGKTHLPILPVINAHVQDGEEIEVILGTSRSVKLEEPYQRNLKTTRDELQNWAQQHNVRMKITEVGKEEPASIKATLSLFNEFVRTIEENWSEEDIFYADVTYGQKPMTLIMLYILRYIRSIKKNVIESVVYGQFRVGGGSLYDLTALFYVDSIIAKVGEMNLPDPGSVVRWSLNDIIGCEDKEGEADDE